MSVSLIPISSNHNEVTVNETLLVFSYSTLAGVRTPLGARYKTVTYHSVTTSKHLNRSGFKDAEEVSPEHLAFLASTALSALATPQPQKG